MILLCVILLVFSGIIFYKTKKIKSLNKDLIKKEAMFFELYDQKFTCFLSMINLTKVNLQDSIFMEVGELRKESLFLKNKNDSKGFINLEDKINALINKMNESDELINFSNESQYKETEELIDKLNKIIESTKLEYNNLVDEFNQEVNDFFGKQIIKNIKEIKKYKNI